MSYLDSSSIRNEYKLWIHKFYLLPSLRFVLTVHEMTASSLKSLDSICNKYLKKWAGLPKGATQQVVHSSHALNIPKIEDLYHLCHTLELTNVRMVSDKTVINAIEDELVRESADSRNKTNSTTAAQAVWEEAASLVLAPTPSSDSSSDIRYAKSKHVSQVKSRVKKILRANNDRRDKAHLSTLKQQGGLIASLYESQLDPEWGSHIHNMNKGTLKFLMNGYINTLSTQNNLKLWGITTSDKCKLCTNRDSTLHVLSGCKVSLDQSRYTWRHNCVLKHVVELFQDSKYTVTSDLPGYKTYGHSTVNPQLTVTNLMPDIVLESESEVFILELTVPFETNVDRQHLYKMDKYAHFVSEIVSKKCTILAWEVGVRGLITKSNKETLKRIHALTNRKTNFKDMCRRQAELAITCSYHIFLNRKNKNWGETGLI